MTAFGGIFRSPKLEGVEESEDSGERGRVVGLDLESGVVRVRAGRSPSPDAEGAPDSPAEEIPSRIDGDHEPRAARRPGVPRP